MPVGQNYGGRTYIVYRGLPIDCARLVYEYTKGVNTKGKSLRPLCGNANCLLPEHIKVTKKIFARTRNPINIYTDLENYSNARIMSMFRKIQNQIHIDKETECWNYTGPTKVTVDVNEKTFVPRRLSYELYTNNKLTDRNIKYILMTCKNKKCINPNHMSLGKPGVKKKRRKKASPTQSLSSFLNKG
jgi:hypothetical protein